MNILKGIMGSVILCWSGITSGQQEVDLARALHESLITSINRTVTPYKDQAAVEMNAAAGDGLAILDEITFDSGILELELLGENSPGRSFIGIAFNIQDAEHYEAIYFRPFNFVATQQLNRSHMVQYICHPDYTWSRLRQERTGQFENEIPDPPDPDHWFRARVKITDTQVEVRMDGREEPVLKVERLSGMTSHRIGLWVGNGSSGRFRNLVLFEL